MPRPKLPPKNEETAKARRTQSPGGQTLQQPDRPRIQFSADGMIEEAPASSWERTSHGQTNDSRSLAELAARVMGSQQLTAAVATEDVTADRELLAGSVQPPAPLT